MDIVLTILEKCLWSGIAAVGFGILFNIPPRTILPVFLLGAIAGCIKFTTLHYEHGFILASFLAAGFVGFACIPISSRIHTSPFVLSIPSIIPMIPGYFGYKTLLGILKLAVTENIHKDTAEFFFALHNGLLLVFILLALSIGISLPWLALRNTIRKKLLVGHAEDLV